MVILSAANNLVNSIICAIHDAQGDRKNDFALALLIRGVSRTGAQETGAPSDLWEIRLMIRTSCELNWARRNSAAGLWSQRP